jgi:hypothetical protein
MYIVYVLFIVYVTLPPDISPIAVGINNNNNNNNNKYELVCVSPLRTCTAIVVDATSAREQV